MRYEAIVVGGGIVGLSTAWGLAKRGLGPVAVLERGPVAAGATLRSAGVVTAQLWTPEDIQLALRTQKVLAELEAASGGLFRIERDGSLTMVGPGQEAHLHRQAGMIRAAGGEVELWEPERVAGEYPAILTEGITLALYTPRDGTLRPAEALAALGAAARAAGVHTFESTPVEHVAIEGGRVRGVYVAGEVLEAPRVILAAGIWTRQIARNSGFDLPLKAFRTQVSAVVAPEPIDLPEMTDAARGIYCFSRRPRTVFFGYGTEIEGIDPDAYRQERDEAEEEAALARLAERIPILRRARPAGGWAGVCDISADVLPLIGAQGEIDGLYLNCGFAGYGISRGPGAGDALAAVIAGEEPGLDLGPYRADRHKGFEDFEIHFGGPWQVSVRSDQVGA
ncbi:NAD(P)/FAD-dependent oxidoreductase [Caldinitratiruptor microaerophilus]|uniref:Oxidoreductase n=1 Tax=Caldinitratiruptor microaerophilus TaxID=671077 RepID=A0AA35CRF1_9FIRM|nr:FAD-binding oxidoreductase [Caldinitratiruptor microaerophilus]BDG62425.1 oxidoreductase [Caldinitratiruptor microaerophilus]